IRGAARELAMALDRPFIDIDGKKLIASLEKKKKSGKATRVQIADKTGADSIFLRSVTNVDPQSPTPEWMSRRLIQVGMRPISLAVDITNYVMMELGQPLHAFDAEKIIGTLRVQRAGKYSTLTTLDNQKRKLHKDDLLIADDVKPLALAGTMGGLDSEVTSETRRIAIEAAHFDSVAIAQNSRRHILSSEASRRFERGVDPLLAPIASARAAMMLIELAGAIYVGTSKVTKPAKNITLTFDPKEITALLGATYSAVEIKRALAAIGCVVRSSGKKMTSIAPSWRRDLVHVADIAEEVARFFGYERIPSILPAVKTSTEGNIGLSPLQQRRRGIALALAHRGFTEVHNYPFVSAEQMALYGFTGERAKTFEIANPMSDQFPFLRTHMTPGLEIPTSKRPTSAQIKKIYESVPKQALHVAGVIAGDFENSGWWGKARKGDWSDAVDIASELLEELVGEFEVVNTELAPWHPGRCAEFRVNGKAVAHAGEIHPRVTAALQLPERTSVFALVLDAIPFASATVASPVITMPAAIQDISLFVDEKVTAAEVRDAL
ncbi:MAG: phenylalanine--tRNA ligase subunit beta, partial [Actinobacteria bacterium]|nr:phenylalanine--tRNA ligase subunit beta [Actinomycetota bacterium]